MERLNVRYLSCEEVNIGGNDQECGVYKEGGKIEKVMEDKEKIRVVVNVIKRVIKMEEEKAMRKGKKEGGKEGGRGSEKIKRKEGKKRGQ